MFESTLLWCYVSYINIKNLTKTYRILYKVFNIPIIKTIQISTFFIYVNYQSKIFTQYIPIYPNVFVSNISFFFIKLFQNQIWKKYDRTKLLY